jgi:hypothetical protein
MQVVENWCQVVGNVEGIAVNSPITDHASLILKVETISNVEKYPNLFNAELGHVYTIYLPSDLLKDSGIGIGSRISCRVKMTRPGLYFMHRQHLTVLTR